MARKALGVPEIVASKGKKRLVMVTCYDATFARLVEAAEVDLVLVGDSLGMVIQGRADTLGVTMEQVIYHTRCVAAGLRTTHLVADMPFLSYQVSPEEALRNAGRLVAEGGAQAVKMEGGRRTAPAIRRCVDAGIPVMGHLGLTPQSVHQFGGFRVQGKSADAAEQILEDARALVDAGVYSMVLESIPQDLAARITREVPVPTIGIGASAACDGQVLVIYDLLGMDASFQPRFLKKYAHLADTIPGAIREYAREVREGLFPDEDHSF